MKLFCYIYHLAPSFRLLCQENFIEWGSLGVRFVHSIHFSPKMAFSQKPICFVVTLAALWIFHVGAIPDEHRLVDDLLNKSGYSKKIRPVEEKGEVIEVILGCTPSRLISFKKKEASLRIAAYLQQTWGDYALKWDPATYAGIEDLHLPRSSLWTPDIVAYGMTRKFDSLIDELLVVTSTGSVTRVPVYAFDMACALNSTEKDHDVYDCKEKFGSWTYNGLMLDLVVSSEEIKGESIPPNPAVQFVSGTAKKQVKHYTCCPEPYPSVEISLRIKVPKD